MKSRNSTKICITTGMFSLLFSYFHLKVIKRQKQIWSWGEVLSSGAFGFLAETQSVRAQLDTVPQRGAAETSPRFHEC